MMWFCYMLTVVGCCTCGTVLVMTDHYGWAWIPFIIAITQYAKESKK